MLAIVTVVAIWQLFRPCFTFLLLCSYGKKYLCTWPFGNNEYFCVFGILASRYFLMCTVLEPDE